MPRRNNPDLSTDDQITMEYERLRHDPYVQLAQAEQRAKYRLRQYVYQLRWLERHGRELANAGYSVSDYDPDSPNNPYPVPEKVR